VNPARVLEVALSPDAERIEGFHVDSPQPDESMLGHELTVRGWAIGLGDDVELVEIVFQGEILGTARLEEDREDVLEEHPRAGTATVGWATKISLIGLPPEFELFVRAVFVDDFRVRMATIRGERQRVLQGEETQIQLDQHPAVLAYRPFEYEPRAVSYWAEILGTLTRPASYLQPLATNLSSEHWWIGGESVPMDLPQPDRQVEAELAQVGPEAIARLCKERIASFYEAVASSQKKPQPRYFAEKVAPDPALWRLTTELFPATQEVILVRDFRDMACSILAYNQKTKVTSFGRERVETDLEFLGELRAAAENLLRLHHRRGDAAFLLRYEDLILKPEETLSELFDFLGVASSQETIAAVLERASNETQAMAGHRTSGDPRQSVGRWQRDLDPELQQGCVDVLDDVLVEFGYEATAQAIG
jgi:hypothetical protein